MAAPRRGARARTNTVGDPQQEALLTELTQIAEGLGVEVRTGKYGGKGGMARVRDRWVVLCDQTFTAESRIQLLAEALGRLDTSQVYLRPDVRELIERCGDAGAAGRDGETTEAT